MGQANFFADMGNTAPNLACAWNSTTTTTNAREGDAIRTNSQGWVYFLHHMILRNNKNNIHK
jgi:hypothetical protein